MHPWSYSSLLLAASYAAQAVSASPVQADTLAEKDCDDLITPKVFIIDMFAPEAEIWWGIEEFDLLAQNITVPGFSPIYPDAYCTASGEICQLITGESEINAASTLTALWTSGLFNLTDTYFFVAGIAGISPKLATTGSVTFARYAVQVALQYEIDAREMPSNWSTGYWAFGTDAPNQFPTSIYGSEVYELNDDLKKLAVGFAKTATLNDSSDAIAYRANYANGSVYNYSAGAAAPSVVECDVATSDVYFSGALLGEAFENTTSIWTNGSGVYCSTAQEDNATLESLLRGALAGLIDFSRIIVMRTASDFDRPYEGEDASYNLLYADQGGFEPAIQNIYLAGVKVVEGIIAGWEKTFRTGVTPSNYIGNIFGSLGGTPDFGLGSVYTEDVLKRDLGATNMRKRNVKRGIPVRVPIAA